MKSARESFTASAFHIEPAEVMKSLPTQFLLRSFKKSTKKFLQDTMSLI